MSRNDSHSPHSPDSLAHSSGRMAALDSPRPLCNRAGGRVSAFTFGPVKARMKTGRMIRARGREVGQ
jgi:hypothetical protein